MDAKKLKSGAIVVRGILGEYMLYHDGLVLQVPGGQWVLIKRNVDLKGWR